jgi:hypothetical protein
MQAHETVSCHHFTFHNFCDCTKPFFINILWLEADSDFFVLWLNASELILGALIQPTDKLQPGKLPFPPIYE